MAIAKRKKLYFDYDLRVGTSQVFACMNPTGGPVNGVNAERLGYTGDSYRGVFEAMSSTFTTDPPQLRLRRAVTAWCAPYRGEGVATPGGPTYRLPLLEFVNCTTTVGGAVALPGQAGDVATHNISVGSDGTVVFTSRFGIKLIRNVVTGNTVGFQGTLYVQRQHDIEI